jgi:uncharacterized protein YndB with AHSA1/START domain
VDFDPKLDLQQMRDIDVPVADVWRAWTSPEVLKQWFCPRPWKVVECDIDLRPGGRVRTVMQSPEGQNMPANAGAYLVVEPEKRLVWTNALGPGYRPNPPPDDKQTGFVFVVDLRLEPMPNGGTRYHARVMHATEAGREAHAAMGFEQGWNIALDQLVALMKDSG